MSGILSIEPVDAKKLHPSALEWFNDQRTAIAREVALDELTDDDLNTFLSDDEKREFMRCEEEITRGLAGCMSIGDRTSADPVSDAIIGLTVVAFKIESLSPMDNIKSLLKKVYHLKREEQRKREDEQRQQAEKVKEEQREKEGEERWCAACKAINPPTDDVKNYLDDEEYSKFIEGAQQTITAYMEKGEAYTTDARTFNYHLYLEKIVDRKEKEAQKLRATFAANEYNHRLNQGIAKLTSQLDHRLKDLSSYFRAKLQDKRFTGHNLDYVLSAKDKGNFDDNLVSVANRKLLQLIPDDLHQFIGLPAQYYRLYFSLPTASYSFEEVPCIDFSFEIFAAAYAEVWLKPAKKSFGDYEFLLPQIEEKDYSVTLQKPKFLGYYYLILRPEDFGGYVFWDSIPLILLKSLLNGEIKPEGTTISAASDEEVTYRIPKVEHEITIPNSFASYLKTIGTIDKMLSMNILTEKVASIVIPELNELKVEQKDTKKAKAFELFGQGKRPGDPEVKSLGIKPNTAYRYHQEWKKTRTHT